MTILKRSLTPVSNAPYQLTASEFTQLSRTLWNTSLGKVTKSALLLKAISDNPYAQTTTLRNLANCANVPDLVANINKKLMNHGLMIVRIEPVGVPRNADFHKWCLVKANITHIPVQMSVNDPTF
ncbi:hypothetical protein ACRZ5S_22460 (plasmid) [Vibrio scophthalmi]|uniref:hypothetical protein n=1 Tax=Vibrio scophthalmi TaxID=45658 RepID=UPI003EBC0425